MKSISLVLTPEKTIADGVNEIKAEAQVIVDGVYPYDEPVTFVLDSSKSATFVGSDHPTITISHTDILGLATAYFTDTVAETGNITAKMAKNVTTYDKKTFEFTSAAYIDLSIRNDYATVWNDVNSIPSESSTIYAVTTVYELATDEQASLTFQIDNADTAWFIDKANPQSRPRVYNARVMGGETIEVGIADSRAEAGLVSVSGTTESLQILRGTTQEFCFVAESSTSCRLDLNNNGAEAGGSRMITATATAFVNGASVPGKRIDLKIQPNTCSAYFLPTDGITIENDGKSAYGNTNNNGEVSVHLVDKVWESGTIVATVFNQNLDCDQREFFFDIPSALTIDVVSLVETTTGSKEWVEFNMAAADGMTRQKVFVDLKNQNGDIYPNNLVQIDLNGVGIFALQQPNGVEISSDRKTVIVPTQSDGRTTPIEFLSDYQGLCSVTATTPPKQLIPSGAHSRTQVHICNFNDPWTNVSDILSTFPDATERARLLYANGRHQTGLTVSIQAASPAGDLTINSMLPQAPFKTAKLADYVSGFELGKGDFANWQYSTDPSGSQFIAPIIAGSPSAEIGADATTMQSENYYITSSEDPTSKGSNYSFGFIITPTGPQVVSTNTMGKYGYNIGTNVPTPPVIFTANRNVIAPNKRVAINLLPPITYNSNMMYCLGVNTYAGPPNALNGAISLYPDNYWRQWDYTIEIGTTRYNSHIFKCILSDRDQLPADYAVAEIRRNIYNYKVYLWPNNITDENGTKIATHAIYSMSSDDVKNINISNIKDVFGAIQVTLFCSFGVIDIGASFSAPININIFDQYGNMGEFHIDGTKIPTQYDKSQLGKLNLLNDGITDKSVLHSDGSNTGYILTNFNPSRDMRIGHDDTQDFIDYKEAYLNNGDKIIFERLGNDGLNYYINNDGYGYLNYYNKNDPIIYNHNEKAAWYFSPLWKDDSMIVSSVDNGKSWYAGTITVNSTNTLYAVFGYDYQQNSNLFKWKITA